MALQLLKTLPSGHTADYWRVSKIDIDANRTKADITLELYKDHAARLVEGTRPIKTQMESFSGEAFPYPVEEVDMNVYELAYEAIKSLDEFDGALDV